MPRLKAHRCHTCGLMYVTARCPKCYPPKGKRRGGRGRSVGRRGRGRVSVGLSWGGGWPITASGSEDPAGPEPSPQPSPLKGEGARSSAADSVSRMKNDYAE